MGSILCMQVFLCMYVCMYVCIYVIVPETKVSGKKKFWLALKETKKKKIKIK